MEREADKRDEQIAQRRENAEVAVYVRPRLVRFGTLADITAGLLAHGGTRRSDAVHITRFF